MKLETEQVQPLQMAAPVHRRIRRKQLRIGILFMAPAFLVIAIFMLGPAFWSIYISGTNTSLTGVGAAAPQWVGVQNFVQILHDAEFFNAFRVSLTYLVGSALIGQAVLGLLLAMLMRRRQRAFKAVLGGIIIVAWVIPDVVAGFLWASFLAGGPQSVLPRWPAELDRSDLWLAATCLAAGLPDGLDHRGKHLARYSVLDAAVRFRVRRHST